MCFNVIADVPEQLSGEGVVLRLDLLQADDIGLGGLKPAGRASARALMPLMLKVAIFILGSPGFGAVETGAAQDARDSAESWVNGLGRLKNSTWDSGGSDVCLTCV